MTFADRLGQWVAGFDAAQVPDPVIDRARLLLLDTLGCAISATGHPDVEALRVTLQAQGGTAQVTAVGQADKTSLRDAILLNGAMVRMRDLNDYYWGPRQGGHPSDNIPVALACGEWAGRSGRDVLAAIVLGYEIYLRLQDSADPDSAWDHISATAITAPCMAGWLLGLDAGQIAEAVAISAVTGLALGALRQGQLSAAKGFANAGLAAQGAMAALYAQAGLTGPREGLERSRGWSNGPWLLDDVTAPLDGGWRLMQAAIKTHPCIATGQCAVQAAIEAHGKVTGGISAITLRIADHPLVREQVGSAAYRAPGNRETADHSLFYLTAICLAEGTLTEEQYERECWSDPAVRDLMRRTTILPDLPMKERGYFPATIALTLESGANIGADRLVPDGHPKGRLDWALVSEKFRRETGGRAEAVIGQVEALDQDLSVLMAALRR